MIVRFLKRIFSSHSSRIHRNVIDGRSPPTTLSLDSEVLLNKGLDSLRQLDIPGAIAAFSHMTQIYPLDHRGFVNLSVAYLKGGSLEKAIQAIEYARTLAPSSPEAAINYAIALRGLGRVDVAIETLSTFSKTYGTPIDVGCMLANLIGQENGAADALVYLQHLCETQRPHPQVYNAIADHLYEADQRDEAEAWLFKALALDQRDAATLIALGRLHRQRGEVEAAERFLVRAVRAAPTNMDAHFNLSLIHLARREYSAGWDGYDCRLLTSEKPSFAPNIPLWQPVEGPLKHVLVVPEQGLGDEIMFASCLSDLKNELSQITLGCDSRLTRLFCRSFPDIDVVPMDRQRRNFQFLNTRGGIQRQIAQGSLPRRYRRSHADFGQSAPFLFPDTSVQTHLRERIAMVPNTPVIGIAWRGGTGGTKHQTRSVPLQDMLMLQTYIHAYFVVLQHDATPDEIATLTASAKIPFYHSPETLSDIDHTAALIAACDLVITVPTTVVHLSGGLGISAWVLVPPQADWRYGLSETWMDWYATVRVFRKQHEASWKDLVVAVGKALTDWNRSRSVAF